MNKHLVRGALMFAVLLATISVFSYYVGHHPEIRHQLSHTPVSTLTEVFILYLGFLFSLILITGATLRLCDIKLGLGETSLLTIYTAIINFFGPLQSGPAFRAVYLKRKHAVNLKDYAKATLAYYGFYACFCLLFLLTGVLKWWALPLLAAGVLAAIWSSHHKQYLPAGWRQLQLQNWYYLAGATFLQLVFTALIFHTELHSLAPTISLSQAIIYAGAGSLALFVSITPGAIGFRESFQALSQHLHHISSGTIVAANIIDRAVYILLLGLLAIIVFGTHANRLLRKPIDG